jgi:protein TonB
MARGEPANSDTAPSFGAADATLRLEPPRAARTMRESAPGAAMSGVVHAILTAVVIVAASIVPQGEDGSDEIPVDVVSAIPGTSAQSQEQSGGAKPSGEAAASQSESSQQKLAARPEDSDRPQEARARASQSKEDAKGPSPFGALSRSAGTPAAPSAGRLPLFASPQQFVEQANAAAAPPKDTNDNYRAKVLELVAGAQQTLPAVEARGAHGLAIVGFSLKPDGTLENAWMVRASGDADLDAEALAMVRRAGPYPAAPPNISTTFAAAIEFGKH